MNNEDISRQLNISKDIVDLAIDSFWEGVYYHLNNPLDSKSGIYFNNLFTFEMNKYSIYKFYKEAIEKNKNGKYLIPDKRVEFYEKLLKNLQKHERKDKKKIYDERLDCTAQVGQPD